MQCIVGSSVMCGFSPLLFKVYNYKQFVLDHFNCIGVHYVALTLLQRTISYFNAHILLSEMSNALSREVGTSLSIQLGVN